MFRRESCKMTAMEQKRILTLDIAKAICIMLMVAGHTACPQYFHDFVYMFHMPCFFFISGWLLSDKYLTNLKMGLYHKAKGSYYPFVKWSLVFTLLHNVFTYLHVYDTTYSFPEMMVRVVRIFTLTVSGGEGLIGGFWFLTTLFLASVISLVFLYLLNRIGKLSCKTIMGGVVLLLFVASLLPLAPYSFLASVGTRKMLATAFFLSGYLCRKGNVGQSHSWKKTIAYFILPGVAACFIYLNMVTVEGYWVWIVYVIAMSGTFGVIHLSGMLAKTRIAPILSYVGNKTLYILVFHFTAFALVTYIYKNFVGEPIENLMNQCKGTYGLMWIVYTLMGITLPVLIWEVRHKASSGITRRQETGYKRQGGK